jgi:hypothetical protein
MPVDISDDIVVAISHRLARYCHCPQQGVHRLPDGLTKQAAVRLAVQAELDRDAPAIPLRERFAALRAADPLRAPTGIPADKAFFD